MKYIKTFEAYNANRTEGGKYLSLEFLTNGLKVSLTDEGKEKALEDGLNIDNFWDYFEDIHVNSELSYHANLGDSGLGLTSAEGITDGYYVNDDGNWTDEGHEDAELYWFPNYEVEDFCETLLKDGSVFFTKAD